jgi:hypothetical protein
MQNTIAINSEVYKKKIKEIVSQNLKITKIIRHSRISIKIVCISLHQPPLFMHPARDKIFNQKMRRESKQLVSFENSHFFLSTTG